MLAAAAQATDGVGGGATVSVVGPQFCVAQPLDLTLTMKTMRLFGGNEDDVMDTNGDVVFKVLNKPMFFGSRRVLADATGNPILTLKEKMSSRRGRWEVFRGQSSDARDVLFSLRNRSIFHRSKWYVFMAANSSEQICDFRIEGSPFSKPYSTIYLGESSTTILAQVSKKKLSENSWFSKKVLRVMVNANVDCAFILALVVAIKEVYEARQQASSGAAAAAAAASC